MIRFLSILVTLPVVVLGVGFLFHTSFEPSVFGKYGWGYLIFLVVWWLIVTPGVYLFARFIFRTQELKLRTRTLYLRPSQKIVAFGLMALVLWMVIDRRIQKEMNRRSTAAADSTHAFLQNTPRPNYGKVTINRWGFRGDDIEKEKPADTIRIFVFGGSTVFCGRLNAPDTHTEKLKDKLQTAYPGRNIEVQNLGADWHTTAHSLIKLQLYAQDFKPDVVVIFHGINDVMRSLTPDTFTIGDFRPDYGNYYGAIANRINPKNRWQLIDMQMGFWFSDFRFDRVYTPGPYGDGTHGSQMMFLPKAEAVQRDDWPSLVSFERNLREFVSVAKAKGMKVIIANQAFIYRDDLSADEQQRLWFAASHQSDGKMADLASMKRAMEQFNAASKRVAGDAGVPFVNLEQAVPKTLEFMHDDVHYTPKACDVIAGAMFDTLQTSKWIDAK